MLAMYNVFKCLLHSHGAEYGTQCQYLHDHDRIYCSPLKKKQNKIHIHMYAPAQYTQ